MATVRSQARPDPAIVLREARRMVEPHLRHSVGQLAEPVRTVAGYHFGWWDAQGRPTQGAGGKALRPALTLYCAEAIGKRAEQALTGAVAVELVHSFTLLHDDIMDGDRTRRHRPAAWAVFGRPAAILAGDALLTAAVDVLATQPSPCIGPAVRLLCETLRQMVDGQGADLTFEGRHDVDMGECLAMAAGKTAALTSCACALGALLGGAPASQVEQLRRFGHHLGLAFQLLDDLQGIWGQTTVTGKPQLGDLRARKKSVPVVAALNSPTKAGRQFARLYTGPEQDNEGDLHRLASLIELSGARQWTVEEAQRQWSAADACLDACSPMLTGTSRLRALTQLLVEPMATENIKEGQAGEPRRH
jgi:geranylgeranyl diphosphate synthase type I